MGNEVGTGVLGADVGEAEGLADGLDVVGFADGVLLGLDVGESVGAFVGLEVGSRSARA